MHEGHGIFAAVIDRQSLLVFVVRDYILREVIKRPFVWARRLVFDGDREKMKLAVHDFDRRRLNVERNLTECIVDVLHQLSTTLELLASVRKTAEWFVGFEVGCLAFCAAVVRLLGREVAIQAFLTATTPSLRRTVAVSALSGRSHFDVWDSVNGIFKSLYRGVERIRDADKRYLNRKCSLSLD